MAAKAMYSIQELEPENSVYKLVKKPIKDNFYKTYMVHFVKGSNPKYNIPEYINKIIDHINDFSTDDVREIFDNYSLLDLQRKIKEFENIDDEANNLELPIIAVVGSLLDKPYLLDTKFFVFKKIKTPRYISTIRREKDVKGMLLIYEHIFLETLWTINGENDETRTEKIWIQVDNQYYIVPDNIDNRHYEALVAISNVAQYSDVNSEIKNNIDKFLELENEYQTHRKNNNIKEIKRVLEEALTYLKAANECINKETSFKPAGNSNIKIFTTI